MKNIYMIGNAHIDPVWFWTWQDGYQEVKATFRSALDRMNENPDQTIDNTWDNHKQHQDGDDRV